MFRYNTKSSKDVIVTTRQKMALTPKPQPTWPIRQKNLQRSCIFFFQDYGLSTFYTFSLLGQLNNGGLTVAPVHLAVLDEVSLRVCQWWEVELLAIAEGVSVRVVHEDATKIHRRSAAAEQLPQLSLRVNL